MLKLPTDKIDQLPKKELSFIFDQILMKKHSVRLIGGCIRDLLLDRPVTDFDIATSMPPEKIVDVFAAIKKESSLIVKCIPTAIKYGTVTLIVNNKKFEITTLRKDTECLGRAAKVEFIDDWKADAKRRDFTINAMSMDLFGNIYDYFNGYKDAIHSIVKFIGNPKKRIEEDYLRALRYFRFCSYLGLESIDQDSLSASLEYMQKLSIISSERIKLEVERIFTAKYSKSIIKLLISHNCLQYIGLPKFSTEDVEKLNVSDNFIINLSALLIMLPELSKQKVDAIITSLKLSNKEKTLLNNLCFPKTVICFEDNLAMQDKYIYMLGKDLYISFLDLQYVLGRNLNFQLLHNNTVSYKSKKLPINGFDILSLGFDKQNVGDIISMCEEYWVDNDFRPKKKEILEYAKETFNRN